jgi:hypothetical protein
MKIIINVNEILSVARDEGMWESGGTDPFILILHTGWRLLISITPRPLSLSENGHSED